MYLQANTILMRLQESKEIWTRAHEILEQTKNPNTQFFSLQILDNVIQTQWKALPQVL